MNRITRTFCIVGMLAVMCVPLRADTAQTETARVVMAEAAKHRMVLEKLRETQERRWREELGRKEMMALDEVAMQIAFGQTAGGHESEHA